MNRSLYEHQPFALRTHFLVGNPRKQLVAPCAKTCPVKVVKL